MATATPAAEQDEDLRLFEIGRQMRIEAARRAAQEGDILLWGKALFPEKFSLPFCATLHGHFIRIRHLAFTNSEAPRNHAKTTIKCFLIPIYQALNEPSMFRYYLNVQATLEKAMDVNRSIKIEIEQNEELRELYGDQMNYERWTDQKFVLKNGVVFTALGAGQSIRGLNYRNRRPDYIIVDDLYDEDDIYNPDGTQKKNKWFWGSLYPARAKSRRNCIHVQGTAINNYDILEELKKKPGVVSATFRAIENMEERRVLWPELNTFEGVQKEMALMGPLIGARELQNERMDEKTSILKRQYWRYYMRLPNAFDVAVTSWDMTFKTTKSGSYVCGLVMGRRGSDFYIFPCRIRRRMGFVETVESFEWLATEAKKLYSRLSGHLVEDKANGPAVMSMLAKSVPGLVPILPHGSKLARAAAVTPVLAAGNVWLPHPSICPADEETGQAWVDGYVEECSKFRGVDSEINDQVDTTTQGLIYLLQTRYPAADQEDGEPALIGGMDDDDEAGGFSE